VLTYVDSLRWHFLGKVPAKHVSRRLGGGLRRRLLLALSIVTAVVVAWAAPASANGRGIHRYLAQGSPCAAGIFTGSHGYQATTFATGLPAGPFGTNACDGAFGLAFDGQGNVYVSDQYNGNLYRFPPSGGSAGDSNYLGHALGGGAYELAFGNGGQLYGIEPAPGGNITAGTVVQLSPQTGALIRVVTKALVLPTWLAVDQRTGDLYVTNGGSGGNFSPDMWQIQDPASTDPAHPPNVSVFATDSAGFNGVAVAPDGTVYALTRDARLVSFRPPRAGALAAETTVAHVPSNSIFSLTLGSIASDGAPTSVYIDSSSLDQIDLANGRITTLVTSAAGAALGNMRVGPDGCLYVGTLTRVIRVSPTNGSCGVSSDLAAYVPTPAEVSWSLKGVAQSWFWVALLIVIVGSSSILFNATLDANYAVINGWFAPLRRRLTRKSEHRDNDGEPTTWRGWRGLAAYLVLGGLIYTLRSPSIRSFADFAIGIAAGSIAGMEVNRRRMAKRHEKIGEPFARPATLLVAAAFVLISVAASARPGYVFGIVIGLTFIPALEEPELGVTNAFAALLGLGIGVAAWFLRWPLAYGLAGHPGALHGFVADVLAVIFVSSIFSVAFGMAPLRFLPGHTVRKWHQGVWICLWALGLFALVHILESGYGYSSASQERTPTMVLGVALLAFSVAFWAYFRQRDARTTSSADSQVIVPVGEGPRPSPINQLLDPAAYPKD
jgi:hypothetical protein